jgi:hypothetical protein
MTKSAYHQVKDGEWIRIRKRNYRDACCDCGLVHTLNFRIVDGTLEMQAFRNERATAAMRRGKK